MSRRSPAPMAAELSERLGARGQRPTAQRLLVLDALRRTTRTLTAAELYEQLRRSHPLLGRATVFRSLDSLVDAGLAQRFERPGHVYAYAACSGGHHHHLVCTHCDRTIEIDEASIAQLVAAMSERHGFSVDHASLDFYGRCDECAAQKK
jgi:Fur family transcriptional regulator, ferric uptake regulator